MTKEEKQRELERRAAELSALKQHPSYDEWVAEIERRIDRDKKRLVADYITQGKPVDQRVIDYLRGLWDGMHYAIVLPAKAEDTLEKALRQSETMKEVQP